jgi:transposase-like protein
MRPKGTMLWFNENGHPEKRGMRPRGGSEEGRETHNLTAACTRAAVRRVTEPHDGVAEAARHWGSPTTRRQCGKGAAAAQEPGAFPRHGRLAPAQAALPRLRAAHTRCRLARAIGKNATTGVANAPPCETPGWSRRTRHGPLQCWVRGSQAVGGGLLPPWAGPHGRPSLPPWGRKCCAWRWDGGSPQGGGSLMRRGRQRGMRGWSPSRGSPTAPGSTRSAGPSGPRIRRGCRRWLHSVSVFT